MDENRPDRFEVEKIMGERLEKLIEGLPRESAIKAIEQLVDDFTYAHFGFSITRESRKVRKKAFATSTCYQPLNDGKAMLISPYGYNVVSMERVGPSQRMQITILESNENERWEGMGDGGVGFDVPRIPHLQRGGLKKNRRGK